MATGLINIVNIRKQIVQEEGKIEIFARKLVQSLFDDATDKMLDNFDNHPVTQEILAGPEAANTTNTLANYTGEVHGNLYAFLGFDKDEENPILKLRELIKSKTYLDSIIVKDQSYERIHYRFIGHIPTVDDIERATALQWVAGSSRSWVAIVENGTNTFSYYLYKLYSLSNPPSRSGRAIQAKTKAGKLIQVHSGAFQTTPYTTEIIQKFVKEVGTTQL